MALLTIDHGLSTIIDQKQKGTKLSNNALCFFFFVRLYF